MKVVVVAEYYPRAADPALGVWAHRQALAARDAGAEVEVLVLHRPVPSKAALRERDRGPLLAPLRQPLRTTLDGIARHLRAVRRAAAAALVRVVGRLGGADARARAPAQAVRPRPRALRRARGRRGAARADQAPLVISVHGGDVLGVAGPLARRPRGRRARASGREAHARQLERDRRAQPRARSRGRARRAPRHRRPAAVAHRRHDARHRRQPDRPQAPRRRPARALAAARRRIRSCTG